MLDLQELEITAQLVDNIEKTIANLEKAYNNKNGVDFKESKNEILASQQKIAEILK